VFSERPRENLQRYPFPNANSGVEYGMPLLLVLTGNFFVFILCLIGAQSCFFGRQWRWFFLTIALVVASASFIVVELSPWVFPATRDRPAVIRYPTTPF
jgi:hypothetical protein